MGKRTTTNQGRTISTKGTGDWACAIAPDSCWVDKSKRFEPFNNSIDTSHLREGTKVTTIAGESIWIQSSNLGPTSGPPHDGTKGQYSGKPAHGEARAVFGSPTVFAEGQAVVRMHDFTFQDAKNTFGMVLAEKRELDLSKGAAADGSADGAGGKGRGKVKKGPARRPRKIKDPGFPKTGTEPVPECWVTDMLAFCSHGRAPKNGLLEVCDDNPQASSSSSPDKVTLRAGVNGICGKPHPVWTLEGQQKQAGLEYVLELPAGPNRKLTIKDLLQPQLPSRESHVACNGCKTGPHRLTVRAYEGLWCKEDYKLDQIPALKRIREGVNALLAFIGVADISVKFLEGSIQVDAKVKEHTDHRVFGGYKITFDVAPLISMEGEYVHGPKSAAIRKIASKMMGKLGKVGKWLEEGGGKVNQWVSDFGAWAKKKSGETESKILGNTLSKVGGWTDKFNLGEVLSKLVDAGPYIKVAGSFSIKGEIERTTPDDMGRVTKPVGLTGTEFLQLGLKCNLLNGALFAFDFNGKGQRTSSGSLFVDEQGTGIQDAKLEITSLAVQSRIKLMNGSWGDSAAYPGMEGVQNPDTWDFIEQSPGLKEALCQSLPGKLHLYKFH